MDFKNYALIKSFTGHNNEVCTIKKIIHPTYGECLFSQGLANEQIKMWINGWIIDYLFNILNISWLTLNFPFFKKLKNYIM